MKVKINIQIKHKYLDNFWFVSSQMSIIELFSNSDRYTIGRYKSWWAKHGS